MVALLQHLMAISGAHTGTAIKNAIDNLVGTHDIDVDALQAKIQVIQDILDADPSTPEFDQAQNIITSLNAILARLSAVETTIARLEGDETVAGSVDFKVAAERARAMAAEQANAACCSTNGTALAAHIAAYDTFVTATNASLTTLASDVADNTQAITDEVARATAAETAINDALAAIQTATGASDADLADLTTLVGDIVTGTGLNADGSFTPDTAASDATNLYEYIHDVTAEGADRANTLRRAIRRLARKSRLADNALDARLDILEGDATVAGSIMQIVTDAVATEETRALAAEAVLAQAVADEETRATAAEVALQAQIDSLSGGGSGSIQGVRDELDDTQVGAGLEADGSYAPDATTEYLGSATSLKDADKKLDVEIKGLEDRKADRTEVVLSADIASIDFSALGTIFLDALNCGLTGGTDCDVVTTTPAGGGGDGAVL